MKFYTKFKHQATATECVNKTSPPYCGADNIKLNLTHKIWSRGHGRRGKPAQARSEGVGSGEGAGRDRFPDQAEKGGRRRLPNSH